MIKMRFFPSFCRAFNRQCGYDDINPVLADFEREIDEEGHYQAFKEKYEEIAGKSWISDRKKIKFRREQFIKNCYRTGIYG